MVRFTAIENDSEQAKDDDAADSEAIAAVDIHASYRAKQDELNHSLFEENTKRWTRRMSNKIAFDEDEFRELAKAACKEGMGILSFVSARRGQHAQQEEDETARALKKPVPKRPPATQTNDGPTSKAPRTDQETPFGV